jgi:ribosomal protein S27AE
MADEQSPLEQHLNAAGVMFIEREYVEKLEAVAPGRDEQGAMTAMRGTCPNCGSEDIQSHRLSWWCGRCNHGGNFDGSAGPRRPNPANKER